MIISPPFLPARTVGQTEDAWLTDAMVPAAQAPDLPGTFPVGFHLDWHGGVHLQAPPSAKTVRAIADGTVVFVRNPKPANTDPKDPLNYNRAGQKSTWTDDGCVVIRHQTEIGANGTTGTSLTFYSIYMHLGKVTCDEKMMPAPAPAPAKKGKKAKPKLVKTKVAAPFAISRKEAIGDPGRIYGEVDRIHFEIICDETAMQTILGRAPTAALSTTSNGRTDSVFGEMFFRLAPGQAVRKGSPVEASAAVLRAKKKADKAHAVLNKAQTTLNKANAKTPKSKTEVAKAQTALNKAQAASTKADADLTTAKTQSSLDTVVIGTTSKSQLVGIRFADGNSLATTYLDDGTILGAAPVSVTDAEFKLMDEAQDVIDYLDLQNSLLPAGSTPTPIPSQSAVFELLRFGRILGPDPLAPVDTPHWKKVHLEIVPSTPPGATTQLQECWIDLNLHGKVAGATVSEVQKYSDGDLPPWMKWKLADDSTDGDSRCNAKAVIDILDTSSPPDGKVTPAEARTQLARSDIRDLLAKLLCKFPTEWDAPSIDTRWGWLKTKSPENPTPMDPIKEYAPFTEHVRALCIRRNTAATGATPSFDEFSKILETDSGTTKIPFPVAHWHLHPTEFVRLYRKSGWLSKDELAKIYPDNVYIKKEVPNPSLRREQFRLQVNQIIRKYLVATPARMTHFFGQGAVESASLGRMMEASNTNFKASLAPETTTFYNLAADTSFDKYDNRLGNVDAGDGKKFRGRGMKQLTGRVNYAHYFVYRGFLASSGFDEPWWKSNGTKDATKTPPAIPNPQITANNEYNCIDTGGWYWYAGPVRAASRPINRLVAEQDVSATAIKAITLAINGGTNGLPERTTHTTRIARTLLDKP